MVTKEQIEKWKVEIEEYKDKYNSLYPGNKPSEKCMKSFCDINNIPWPLPKVESDVEYDFLM